MFGKIKVNVADFKDAIVIPLDSVILRNGNSLVFVINSDTAKERKVEPGIRTDGKIQIKSGLESGEQVVTAGVETLFDGAKVQIITRSSAE
jgi:multidrug efflux pump subunit AcrA (membrane-fusion protein)